jgi:hypothetical protein
VDLEFPSLIVVQELFLYLSHLITLRQLLI